MGKTKLLQNRQCYLGAALGLERGLFGAQRQQQRVPPIRSVYPVEQRWRFASILKPVAWMRPLLSSRRPPEHYGVIFAIELAKESR